MCFIISSLIIILVSLISYSFTAYGNPGQKDMPKWYLSIIIIIILLIFLTCVIIKSTDENAKKYCIYYPDTEICKHLNYSNFEYLTFEQKEKMSRAVENIEIKIKDIEVK